VRNVAIGDDPHLSYASAGANEALGAGRDWARFDSNPWRVTASQVAPPILSETARIRLIGSGRFSAVSRRMPRGGAGMLREGSCRPA